MTTVANRLSAINLTMPWRWPPIPDGAIEQGDRQHLVGLYAGILARARAAVEGPMTVAASMTTPGLAVALSLPTISASLRIPSAAGGMET